MDGWMDGSNDAIQMSRVIVDWTVYDYDSAPL